MLIQFTRKVPPYNTGEVAGFPEPEAKRLVRLGAATPAEAPPAPASDGAYPDKSIPQAPANRQMGRKGR